MIRYCIRCVMPSTRPRIVFDDEGVCNACRNAERKATVDWDGRRKEFLTLADQKRKHPVYDCIVPFSGGKDSAVVALTMRDLGLRPLLVTFGQMMWTEVGRRNFHKVADAGFDIHYWRVNQKVCRKLARRFFIERGHPKAHYDAAVNAVPLITAINFRIPLVVFAEHGESEYGGLVRNSEATRERDRAEVLEHLVGDDARNWTVDGLTEKDLYPYIYPSPEDISRVGATAVYASYFFKWDVYANAVRVANELGFERARNGTKVGPCSWGKSDGSFEGFDSIDDKIDDLDYFMMHVKFGFGRATRMACRMLQNGHLTRQEALAFVRRHDGEPPQTHSDDIRAYLGFKPKELGRLIDRHRNAELWEFDGSFWKLRSPPR